MMRALWTAASGMNSQQTNVDTIANNLSNINTAGYKAEKAEFKSLLYQNMQSKSTNTLGENKPISAQVGLGVRMASVTSNFNQGALNETGAYMDWAVEGAGFYKIDVNGTTMYTRNASFTLSIVNGGNGAMVTTANGYPVLDANNQPMIIPCNPHPQEGEKSYSTSSLVVDKSGKLSAVNISTNEREDLGIQVGLVQFANPAGLEKTGNSLYKVTDNSGEPMEEIGSGLSLSSIRQNFIESSNVSAADEMVNLIVAQRAYEMNSKTIQAADSMMQQANELRR